MLNSSQLRELIIKPALQDLNLLSDDAIELLIFTCANESDGGTYIKQVGGPALGIYQMEPATYNDIWQNFIIPNHSIGIQMLHNFNAGRMPEEDRMIYDLRFATAMARLFYARIPSPLPRSIDITGMWNYYKTHYNTSAGKADHDQAVRKYTEFK